MNAIAKKRLYNLISGTGKRLFIRRYFTELPTTPEERLELLRDWISCDGKVKVDDEDILAISQKWIETGEGAVFVGDFGDLEKEFKIEADTPEDMIENVDYTSELKRIIDILDADDVVLLFEMAARMASDKIEII